MPSIAAFANLKGGVGKTTLVLHVAHEAASRGLKVLVIDMDGQCNASEWLTGRSDTDWYTRTLADVLDLDTPKDQRASLADVRVPTRREGIDLIPAAPVGEMTAVNSALEGATLREMVLTKALRKIAAEYDVILIDCPPAINMLTINAHVAAASGIVLVASPTQGAYRGVREMVKEIDLANDPDDGLGEILPDEIQFAGIVVNDVDRRINQHTEYVERLERLAAQIDVPLLGHPIPHLSFIPAAAVACLGMDQLSDSRAAYVREQIGAVLDTITKGVTQR